MDFTQDSVDSLIPQLVTQLEKLPADIPVVIFSLDNSTFMCASEDGSMAPLKKIPEAGPGYHAVGELIMAPDRSLSHSISHLKRLVAACGDRPVFLISPIFRFATSPRCSTAGHMTNFLDPDYVKVMLKDLNRIRILLKTNFQGSTVVDGLELICGPGMNLEKAETAARVARISDPVHPSGHTYAKMALNLHEAMAPTGKLATSTSRKRKHSDSDAGETSGGGSRSKERARAWSDPRRGGHHQPTLRHNSGHYYRHSAARGRGNGGGGGGGHFQPNFQPNIIRGNYRGRGYGGDGVPGVAGGGGEGDFKAASLLPEPGRPFFLDSPNLLPVYSVL